MMMEIELIATTPIDGKMMPPGTRLETSRTVGLDLIRIGKAIEVRAAAGKAKAGEGKAGGPTSPAT